MAKFVFRDTEYDYDILVKVMGEGHIESVDRQLIVAAGTPDDHVIKLAGSVLVDTIPVVYKLEGKYHLLLGELPAKHNKPKVRCITKFTLKKCVAVNTPTKIPDTRSHQERWNAEQKKRQAHSAY